MSPVSSQDQDLDQIKASLRKAQAKIRAEQSSIAVETAQAIAAEADAIITSFGLDGDDIIAGYWPIKTEIDPRPLMAVMAGKGLSTALPATPKPEMPLIFHHWQDGDAMIDGLYGTSEPHPDAPICAPSVLLVPLLAFDDAGYRLGYGGGFYDRSLAELRQKHDRVLAIGIAYDAQRVDRVPIGPYDAQLDGILTQTGLKRP